MIPTYLRPTIYLIYFFARLAIHYSYVLDRVFDRIGRIPILERENELVWNLLDYGVDLGNIRYFYNSPACEIDEMLATHIHNQYVWIVGIWDRRERRAVVEVVGNDRSQENIDRILNSYVQTNRNQDRIDVRTRIYHDGWAAYNYLDRPDSVYEGFRVVHGPDGYFGHDIFSTNRIEGFWADLRRESNFSRGFHYENLREVYIEADVANWRIYNRGRDLWDQLAECILRLTERGGGIGACITNIYAIEEELNDDDANGGMEIEEQ